MISDLERDVLAAEREAARKLEPDQTYEKQVGFIIRQVKDLEHILEDKDNIQRGKNMEIVDLDDLNRRIKRKAEDGEDELNKCA